MCSFRKFGTISPKAQPTTCRKRWGNVQRKPFGTRALPRVWSNLKTPRGAEPGRSFTAGRCGNAGERSRYSFILFIHWIPNNCLKLTRCGAPLNLICRVSGPKKKAVFICTFLYICTWTVCLNLKQTLLDYGSVKRSSPKSSSGSESRDSSRWENMTEAPRPKREKSFTTCYQEGDGCSDDVMAAVKRRRTHESH